MATRKKIKDYHITVRQQTHEDAKHLAELQHRSMRGLIAYLVEQELAKTNRKKA